MYALQNQGFKTIGIDFAPKTVGLLNEVAPELDIRLGDVRALPFESNAFDGYWSLGVIEHFWGGYQQIAVEMHRVLRKGGYLFLTFPTMSAVRTWKAKSGRFGMWQDKGGEPDGFYQFALSPAVTIRDFKRLGFGLVHQGYSGSFKGLKDEVPMLQPFMQSLQSSSALVSRATIRAIDALVPAKWFGHISVLVLRKT